VDRLKYTAMRNTKLEELPKRMEVHQNQDTVLLSSIKDCLRIGFNRADVVDAIVFDDCISVEDIIDSVEATKRRQKVTEFKVHEVVDNLRQRSNYKGVSDRERALLRAALPSMAKHELVDCCKKLNIYSAAVFGMGCRECREFLLKHL
jgi:hypothetical protein